MNDKSAIDDLKAFREGIAEAVARNDRPTAKAALDEISPAQIVRLYDEALALRTENERLVAIEAAAREHIKAIYTINNSDTVFEIEKNLRELLGLGTEAQLRAALSEEATHE